MYFFNLVKNNSMSWQKSSHLNVTKKKIVQMIDISNYYYF